MYYILDYTSTYHYDRRWRMQVEMMREKFYHQEISVNIFTEDAGNDLFYIQIDEESRPFDATGHYPVLAASMHRAGRVMRRKSSRKKKETVSSLWSQTGLSQWRIRTTSAKRTLHTNSGF